MAETLNVKSHPAAISIRLTALALAASLTACAAIDNMLSGEKVDYRSGTTKAKPLEVPPEVRLCLRNRRYSSIPPGR